MVRSIPMVRYRRVRRWFRNEQLILQVRCWEDYQFVWRDATAEDLLDVPEALDLSHATIYFT